MRKRIKLKAHVKPKCDCENHYLELCTVFDGFENTYFRKCTKCGKSWTNVQKTYEVWINPVHIISIAPLMFEGAPDIDEVTMINNQVFYTLDYR